ncbi:MAG TPA: 50S ribosomal protein L17 [Candidatus Acidoferrales bacterium]|nr:50S ribosomal protein L17 [Candidatus Acidoferrales bacterium]
MRHLNAGRKLNRTGAHRKALFRNLVTSLLEHEHVRTTDAKAKELRSIADRMVTLGKRGTLHARRQALTYIRSATVVKKLFDEVAPRFRDRMGGYTRVIKLGHRHGDAASMSIIELTDRGEAAKAEAEKKRERRARRAEKKSTPPAAPPLG